MVEGAFSDSIIKKAREGNLLEINTVQIRDFSKEKRNRVDEKVYGGGSGMLLQVDPIKNAINSVKQAGSRVVYLSPRGKRLNQEKVVELSTYEHIIMLCGHYEGVDQRLIDNYVDEEISIGDFVLTGGELPAIVLVDAVSRYVGGVLGDDGSLVEESFENSLLEYPQYTKPRVYQDDTVPDVLLSGNHQNIKDWRYQKSLETTYKVRKDLFYKHLLDVLKFGDKKSISELGRAIKKAELED